MTSLEYWEMASYIVTVIGFPFAIAVFMLDQRKERENEDDEIYQKLSDEYAEFSILLLKHSDLQLMTKYIGDEHLSDDQKERKNIIFDILVSLFERAFILVYEEEMDARTKRHWSSWQDYIHFWLRRPDFRKALESLLEGEDPDFQNYMRSLSKLADNQMPKPGSFA